MGGGSIVGGRYELVRKLAEGGMGAVWEARHTLSRKTVALKIINAESAADETSRARFLREVAAPAQIGHEGIVEVYDAGFDAAVGSLFVAMEMLEGETLRALLSRGGVTPARIVSIVLELLPALAAAHAAGFIHRDLKPENVFLHRRRGGAERVKILDFGIARSLSEESSVTQSGVAMGTPHYMSPEQASSARDVTPATDVWALGVILYEALVHEPPFRGDTLASLVVDVITRPHRPTLDAMPSVPPAVAAIVDRCLEKDATRRPRDAATLESFLRSAAIVSGLVARDAGMLAPPETLDHAPRKTDRAVAPTMMASHDSRPGLLGSIDGRTPAPALGSPGSPTATPRWGGVGTTPQTTVPSAAGYGSAPGIAPTATFPSSPGGASSLPSSPGASQAPSAQVTSSPASATPNASDRPPWFWPLVLGAGAAVVIVPIALVMAVGLFFYASGARTVRGTLAGGDLTLAGGQLYDSYPYDWRAGGRLELHARSTTFDTHIILHTPSGRQLDSSDGDGARIDMTLVESGQYRVIVTSRRAFQLGDYELDVDGP